MIPPECEMAIQQFDAFRRGELAPRELVSLRSHLDTCRRCYAFHRHENAFLERLLAATRNARCPEQLRTDITRLIAKESRGN
ncbi:MAG: zf-HC2 domain-containing protein [Gemmatimonadales bacterium]